jgi:hypothetical protein
VDRELEIRIGIRTDAALDRIRSKVHLTGMAGQWHIGKALAIIDNPSLLDQYVERLGEHEAGKYLDELPALVKDAKEQDRCCAECWGSDLSPEQQSRYRVERGELIRLFQRLRFRPKLYERLVRQPDKSLLRQAIRLLSAEVANTPVVVAVEAIVRMSLQDFVLLEEGLVDDCRDLDDARGELCAAHEELALTIARSQPRSEQSVVSSALVGLRRAATWYDSSRGYSFAAYAQYWIQEAIDKRRG